MAALANHQKIEFIASIANQMKESSAESETARTPVKFKQENLTRNKRPNMETSSMNKHKLQKKLSALVSQRLAVLAISFGFVAVPFSVRSNEAVMESSNQPIPEKYLAFPWEAMQIPDVAASYKKAFGSYWLLNWVKSPALGERGVLINDPEFGPVVKYEICRPRYCATERLLFIYRPSSKQGWGKIRIDTDLLGDRATKSLERLVTEQMGETK